MSSVTMKKISRTFLPAVLTCFLIGTAYSNVQHSCHVTTDQVSMKTAYAVSMATTSDWKATDLCVCHLSTPHASAYMTFDLLTPSGQRSDAICGPYLIVKPPESGSFYHICPRSSRSPLGPHSATISNQTSLTVALSTKDRNMPLQGANITFHSRTPVTLTCRQMDNSSIDLESLDCPCDVWVSTTIGQSDFDLPTRLMRGLVVSCSFLVVCVLLLLLFCLNKRYHLIERLKTKMPLCGAAAAKSLTQRGSANAAFQPSNSYDDLPSTNNAQPINDFNDEQIRQLPRMVESQNKSPEMAPSSNADGFVNSGIYEEITYGKRDVGNAAPGDTNSLSPYATFSEFRYSNVRAHLVGRGALSACDICHWNYRPPSVDNVSKRKVMTPPERSKSEPKAEVIYGTVNKTKVNAGNGIPAELSTSKQHGLESNFRHLSSDTAV